MLSSAAPSLNIIAWTELAWSSSTSSRKPLLWCWVSDSSSTVLRFNSAESPKLSHSSRASTRWRIWKFTAIQIAIVEMSTNRFATTMFRWEINVLIIFDPYSGQWLNFFISPVLQSVLRRLSRKKGWQGQKLLRVLLHRRGRFVGRPGNLLDKMQQLDSFSRHPFSHNDTVLRANETSLGHDHQNRQSWFDLTRFCCSDGRNQNIWYNSVPDHLGWDKNCKFHFFPT